MKKALLAASALLTLTLVPLEAQSAPDSSFYRIVCESQAFAGFAGSGLRFTPQKRCGVVSAKFNQFNSKNNQNWLTANIKSGYPIICLSPKSPNQSNVCDLSFAVQSNDQLKKVISYWSNLGQTTHLVQKQPTSDYPIKQLSSFFLLLGMTTTLGTSLLKHIITEIHNPNTGLIDGILFADILGLSHEEMAKMLDRTVAGLRKNPTSDKLQPTLLKLYVLTVKLRDLSDNSMENVRIYLRSPHPQLNYQTPLSYLVDGKFEEIETLINCLEKQKVLL